MADVIFDASEFTRLGRAFQQLPRDLKVKVFERAMRRMRDMTRTRVVKRSAERTDLPTGKVGARTRAVFQSGGSSIEVIERSGWISLSELGARQTKTGVSVRLRGSYRHAFLATMASGHKGVMIRTGSGRLPIRELYGPNPAHDVTNNPDVFLKVLTETIEDHLLPRIIHELERALPQ